MNKTFFSCVSNGMVSNFSQLQESMSFFSSRSRVLVDLNFIEVKCLSKEIIPEVVFDRYRAL